MICTTCGACKEGGTAWVWLDMLNLVIYHGDRKLQLNMVHINQRVLYVMFAYRAEAKRT